MRVPKRIEPQPLLDVSVSLLCRTGLERSENNRFWSAILSDQFRQMDIVRTVPESEDVEGDQRLISAVRFFDQSLSVTISGDQLSFRTVCEYPGWTVLRSKIERVLNPPVNAAGHDFGVGRVWMRYLNFFAGVARLEDVVRVDRCFPAELQPDRRFFRLRRDGEPGKRPGFDASVADRVDPTQDAEEGLIVDVATWIEARSPEYRIDGVVETLDSLHAYEKRVFVSLIQPQWLRDHVTEWEEAADERCRLGADPNT